MSKPNIDRIYIPQLTKAPEQTETIDIRDYLPGLDTLTPVQATVRVTHCGNYLQVAARGEAIMTLTCDRCLQQYNHRLLVNASEMIWLEEPVEEEAELEREVDLEDLVESLPPNGYFHPDEWLYEQFCLEIPQRKLCDQECPGIQVEESNPPPAVLQPDHRWASLEALRNQLLN
jgi:uncharacterized protein